MTERNKETLPTLFQQYIAVSKYSRWLDDLQRREIWPEPAQRYVDNVVRPCLADAGLKKKEIEEVCTRAFDAISRTETLPSMRALMTAGPALERDHMAAFNCSYVAIDHPRAFDEALYILSCGTGLGFSVERQFISQLPDVSEEFHDTDTTIVVADSKIGWASSFRELIGLLYSGRVPRIDVSKVRPAGARLKTFGGRASGPGPLMDLFEYSIRTFRGAAGRKLNSIECHGLMCKIGEAIVVGGVRRSALISLSNLTDQRLRNAKSGEWRSQHPEYSLANNSVAYTEKPDTDAFLQEWLALYQSKSGERGIFNRDGIKRKVKRIGRRDHEHQWGTNPCVTGNTMLLTEQGYFPIGELVGQDVRIWNGAMWSAVKPFSTGVNDIVRVHLSSGLAIDCTLYHEFLVDDSTFFGVAVRTEAQDLKVGSKLQKWELPPPYDTWPQQTVVRVEQLNEQQETFCVTEPILNQMTVNGIVTGNCSEIALRSMQTCNLTEVVIRPDDSLETLKEKVELATILGTIQSTFTSFRYLRPAWKRNIEEERLLGVSFTGIFDHPIMSGQISMGDNDPEDWLDELRKHAVETNKVWAGKLGINQSTAVTCCKPAGTTSLLSNTASGIHPRHSEWYIRAVRQDNKDALTALLKDQGIPNEPCAMRPESTTVFYFPMEAPAGAVCKADLKAIDHLNLWRTYNHHWAEHTVSVTVSVQEDEWMEVGAWVFKNFDDITGISFLPADQGSYKQAPFQACTYEEYTAAMEKMPASIDWSQLSRYEVEDETTGSRELACVGGACEIP